MYGKKLIIGVILTVVVVVSVALTVVTNAADPVPPPYAGLKNPFPWDDTSIHQAGRPIYQRSCSCHGPDGGSISSSNFRSPDFPQNLEQNQDFYFWVVSEGNLALGMPGFKATLSEEQRWQVLTFVWSLGKVVPPPTTPPPSTPPSGASLQLKAPAQGQAGQQLTFSVTLLDKERFPVPNATVQFFIRVDFFANGLMSIGEAVTDTLGVGIFDYTPHLSGDIQIVATYQDIEADSPLTLTSADKPFYQTEAGIRMPHIGDDVFYGPPSAKNLGELGQAPTGGFRLPGGVFSWLWLFIIVIILIWVTYFRVIYQVYRIPDFIQNNETDIRLLPFIGLAAITILGIILVAMLFHGPYSHFHLLP